MENASKALIIAGAILVAILLISVGIMIISSTGGIQEQVGSQMDAAEIRTFNAQFSSYIGTNKTAAQVRALYETVNSSNATNAYKISMSVTGTDVVKDGATTSDAATIIAGLSTRDRYTIAITQDATGTYNAITVTKV